MKTFSQLRTAAKVNYNDLPIRIALAIIAAHFIVAFDEEETFLELLQFDRYYYALFGSIVIASILIEVVYRFTSWLDKGYLWIKLPISRAWRQFLYCVVVPLLSSFLLASLYFRYYDISIFDTVYFSKYFIIIVLMILLINGYYIIHYFFKLFKGFSKLKKEEIQSRKQLMRQEKTENLLSEEDIVYIFCKDRNYFYISSEGEMLVWDRTIEETFKQLSTVDYFFVNRNCIVKRSNIKLIASASSRRRKLVLYLPVNEVIYVSQRRTPVFVLWWTGELRPDQLHLLNDFD